ncbi:MAG: helix-turn-helix domain-containing protein [Holosporaceae bacterium]|jgi:transcriptional regulator with XRE-family HTH domain|nr:helix-turn-helix domain-containing protein [Holosporaceae bacterium]
MAVYGSSSKKSCRNHLDSHIGSRVKSRRSFLGISQEKLGNYLGITFQQVQKYEKGINRISASTLYDISNLLSVDLSYFIEGYNGPASLSENGAPIYETDRALKKETTELLRAYHKIKDPSVRKKMLELIKTIAAVQKTN